jgi:hypothetical protein
MATGHEISESLRRQHLCILRAHHARWLFSTKAEDRGFRHDGLYLALIDPFRDESINSGDLFRVRAKRKSGIYTLVRNDKGDSVVVLELFITAQDRAERH